MAMADDTTPVAPRIRSLFPDLDLYSPSPPRLPWPLSGSFTVPRLRRGPMYSVYSELRESKLRRKKRDRLSPLDPVAKTSPTPEKKAAKAVPAIARSIPNFSAVLRKENRSPAGWASPVVPPKGSKREGLSPLGPVAKTSPTPEKKAAKAVPAIARSIPNFSAVLRKENRSPAGWASPVVPPKAVTPPRPPPATVSASSKGSAGVPRRLGGSASANGRDEKGCGRFAVRKSYSCLKELKGYSGIASSAIEEEGEASGGGRRVVKKLARRYY